MSTLSGLPNSSSALLGAPLLLSHSGDPTTRLFLEDTYSGPETNLALAWSLHL